MMNLETLLTIFALIAGVVAVFELLEYLFTRNLPWLARGMRHLWRRVRRRLGRAKDGEGQRYLVLNFSAHPVLPGQQAAIRARQGWPSLEVLDAQVGSVSEGRDFVQAALRCIAGLELLPDEWQTYPLVVVPAGYTPLWSVLLAELHGRMGYFPDIVRLRPAPREAGEKYELAEILDLRQIRARGRDRR
jgi:hypothetical protein